MAFRLGELAAVLKGYGIRLERGTNHPCFIDADGRKVPVVAHNAEKSDLSTIIIKKTAKQLGLDPDEVLERLRRG
ncbi:MAG: hypothetical protein JNM72_12155 [Deltaproteobacteria bacterium]|nr:hypothetical protein [Deltaproteobacteria bacterium]